MAVGAGGADFHDLGRELVEEERRAPVVHEFAAAIDSEARFFGNEFCAIGVFTIKNGGDLFVETNRIAAVAGAVIGDDISHVVEEGCRLHRRCGGGRAEDVRSFGPWRGGVCKRRNLAGG